MYKKLIAILVTIVSAFTFLACTPEEQAIFQTLTPSQQQAVISHLQTKSSNISMHPALVCIRRHESDRGPFPHKNGYTAQNPRSTASGAYQFLNSTWIVASRQAGYPGYSRAMYAPPWVQDAVAYDLVVRRRGVSHWAGSGCAVYV